MELLEAMKRRHSVRQYTDRPIPAEVLAELEAEAAACSREGSLHIQLVTDERTPFRASWPTTASSAASEITWRWPAPRGRTWTKNWAIMVSGWC